MALFRRHRAIAALALAAALATACGSPAQDTAKATGTQDSVDAALKAGGSITYWTWTPSAKAQVAAFEQEYPNVKVNLVNAGTGKDQYTKLQNAIKAGSGGPDVAQIEYQAIPSMLISRHRPRNAPAVSIVATGRPRLHATSSVLSPPGSRW